MGAMHGISNNEREILGKMGKKKDTLKWMPLIPLLNKH